MNFIPSYFASYITITPLEHYNIGRGELKPLLRKIDILSNYSTTETVVGTWVDGKPIYRKVVQSNAHITGSGAIAHNIQNLGTVVNFEGWYIKDGAYFTLPYSHSNTRYLIGVFINTTDINFRCGDLADFDASYFILEYTKTTD